MEKEKCPMQGRMSQCKEGECHHQPIEEKWLRCGGKCVCCDLAESFIENLLEQERQRMSEEIYQARKSNTTDSAGDVWEKVLSIINK